MLTTSGTGFGYTADKLAAGQLILLQSCSTTISIRAGHKRVVATHISSQG